MARSAGKGPGAKERDELDATPPAQFVRARDQLVARLRTAGRQREAAEVARLRRPNPVAWTINRLARTDAAAVRQLLEASDRLRRAALRDPRAAPEATARHRAALQALMDGAERILTGADMRPTQDVLRRVHSTLTAAVGDRGKHAELREGRLTEPLEPGGFEVFAGEPVRHLRVVKPEETEAAAAPSRARRERERERQERTERQAAARQAKAERREAEKRKAEAARRQRAIDRASRQAERLRARLREAEERLRYARDGGASQAPRGRTR
jgi:hypothetical protein